MMTTNSNDFTEGTISKQRVQADDRLDMLYMREMRCPYCQTRMPRGTSKCKNCGLTKEQIYYAKLTSPYRASNNALMSKTRPAGLPYWKMVLGALFGFFGIHCFIAKRYVRGIMILLMTVGFIVSTIAFPIGNETRALFENRTYLFPGDLLGVLVMGLWVWDMFAVIFGQFKYPVQIKLGDSDGSK